MVGFKNQLTLGFDTPDREFALALFIDYDNLLPVQRAAGIRDIVTKALVQLPRHGDIRRARCNVRIYGGWYEGTEITRRAEELSIAIQRDFPAVIRLPHQDGDQGATILTNAELAMSLLEEPGHHLFYTYRRKSKPRNIRVEHPHAVGCEDAACILPLMRRLLEKGTCPKSGCGVLTDDLIYRREQKIVDTMLSCDLIHSTALSYDKIILISGDDDFLPPLRTVLLRGTAVVRIHPKPNEQRASFPRAGARLIEMDL